MTVFVRATYSFHVKPLSDMTDEELERRAEALHQARVKIMSEEIEIYAEQARRRPAGRRYDPDQLDQDEYIEEMSLGGQRYQP